MDSRPIDEVYERNFAVGERLRSMIASIEPAKIHQLPEVGKWTIANIVEHVSIVEESMIKICSKLLGKAESAVEFGNGSIETSDVFGQKALEIATMKLEAPEFVHPSGEKSVEESMSKFEENWQKLVELKPSFEKFDSNGHRFPHPFFGPLSAGEWLTLIGGHKLRHIKQIEELAARL
jgi:hypothetical protein